MPLTWTKFLLLLAFNIVNAEFSVVPENCREKCIAKFDGISEDGCVRGCTLAHICHTRTNGVSCEASCDSAYATTPDALSACRWGCANYDEPSGFFARSKAKIMPLVQTVRQFFVNVIKRMHNFMSNHFKKKPVTESTVVDQQKEPAPHGRVIITHLRIFDNLNPEALDNSHLSIMGSPMNKIRLMMNIPGFFQQNEDNTDVAKPMETQNDKESDLRLNAPSDSNSQLYQHASFGRVSYFFHHLMFRPILLPFMIVLILIVALLFVKLAVHACRPRVRHNYEYSRLPTYIEAVNVKIPNFDSDDYYVSKAKHNLEEKDTVKA